MTMLYKVYYRPPVPVDSVAFDQYLQYLKEIGEQISEDQWQNRFVDWKDQSNPSKFVDFFATENGSKAIFKTCEPESVS